MAKQRAYAPKRNYKKRTAYKGRRRLGDKSIASNPAYVDLVEKAVPLAKQVYDTYRFVKKKKLSSRQTKMIKAQNLSVSDNISTMPATIIGKARTITFAEKVMRVSTPPLLFKRNYQFNAEAQSGRKSWFSFELNVMNTNDLGADLTTYRNQQYTDSTTSDPTLSAQNSVDGSKFYVDYLSQKISFLNSSSNSCIGKIHLFCHRRDNENAYGNPNVPITPINLMMFYSSSRLPELTTANEQTVGNGWAFDNATAGLNYLSVYNMPGSSLNATGVCANTDPALSPSTPVIADSMNYWFNSKETIPFSLKAGEQLNKTFIFNDLPDLMREEQAGFIHVANVSYSVVVEFRGQVVGDATSSNISTGTTQLSCVVEQKRVIGVKQKLLSKVLLITNPLNVITNANQVIINQDTGTTLTGTVIDS